MRIISFKLENYKSISNTNELKFDSKINIFAGKNNTGKTSLIEALYMVASGHLTDWLQEGADCEIEIALNHQDLEFLNRGLGVDEFISTDKIKVGFLLHETSVMIKTIEIYYMSRYLTFWENLNKDPNEVNYQRISPDGGTTSYINRPRLFENIMYLLEEQIVYISGTRHVPEYDPTKVTEKLKIDGTNLNAFLFTLRNNNEPIFNKIKEVFMSIFTDVSSIGTSVVNTSKGLPDTNINLYFEGVDHPIPLYRCGSGFTHVLIMLSILYSGQDRIVLFDEPHVFLHPSAEKAVYDLINEIDYHQYFLTTHSPILINYPFNKKVFLVRKEAGISKVSEFNEVQEIMKDIGLNNSDLAFSDKVLLVEGKTEEHVIPMILSHFGMKQIGYNYKVLDMNGTSNNFNKSGAMTDYRKNLDLILNGISNSPIPYRILIDKDERQERTIELVREKYGDRVLILGRREFENYFLDCYEEISKTVNNNSDLPVVTSDQVQQTIESILSQAEETKDWDIFPRGCNNQIEDAIGSEVLDRLFREYKVSIGYDKVKHGIEIVTNILKTNPEKLTPIKNILEDFISSKKTEEEVSYT